MKLTQEQINQRVDLWYEKNSNKLPAHSITLKDEFKSALKHDLYLGQSVMRSNKTHWSFKLKSASTMYKWADLLNIHIIRANELQAEQRLKRNLKIIKMREKNKPVIEIAQKAGITVPAIYCVLEQANKWRLMANKPRTLMDINNDDLLCVLNDLFIAKAVKNNPYGIVGY